MKFKLFIKKCISLMLLLVILVSCDLPYVANAKTNVADGSEQEEVYYYLKSYFSDLLDTIKADSEKDYTTEDFSSVKGYIVAKQLVNKRQIYKKLLGGIEKVRLNEIILEDVSSTGDTMEAMAYVKYSFTYPEEQEECSVGTLYRVILSKTREGYCVLDLDCDDIETKMAKEAILGNSDLRNKIESDSNSVSIYGCSDTDLELDYSVADAYFAEAEQNTESLLQDDISYAEADEDENEISTLSTSASYNKTKARNWGYKLGDNKQNYIFKRASLDCTNFVSQCVWAGYGGTDGYTIPSDPSVNNATCVALKKRVASDYRMTSSWYGRNYDSTLGDPPTNFCSVVNFCNYVSSNTGNGPKATVYNNGKVYTNLSVKMKAGDVLQFYNNSTGTWYHSVIVVTETDYSVSDYKKVKVAQHESDYNNRSLSELISNFGGSSCKMRLLLFKSTTFSE